jgi:hypothetical protein
MFILFWKFFLFIFRYWEALHIHDFMKKCLVCRLLHNCKGLYRLFGGLYSELSQLQRFRCQKCDHKLHNSLEVVDSSEDFCPSCVLKLVKDAKKTDFYAVLTSVSLVFCFIEIWMFKTFILASELKNWIHSCVLFCLRIVFQSISLFYLFTCNFF